MQNYRAAKQYGNSIDLNRIVVRQMLNLCRAFNKYQHLVVGWHLFNVGQLQALSCCLCFYVADISDPPLKIHSLAKNQL